MICILLFLTGCGGNDGLADEAMDLRNKLLSGNGCSFDAVVTADYGDRLYTFGMHCRMDKNGTVTFSVTEPETIEGITGTLSEASGKLTFDDKILAFEMLADGQITPVSAPWHMLRALRSGYLRGCGKAGDGLLLMIDDSYMGDNLQANIYLNADTLPDACELYWKERRFMTIAVTNFEIL